MKGSSEIHGAGNEEYTEKREADAEGLQDS